MSKILNQGGFGCIYFPGINCQGTISQNEKIVTKLQKNNETAQNEIEIGKTIITIKNYISYFTPVIKDCPINLSEINSELLKDCNVITSDGALNYILLYIPYIDGMEFLDFMSELSSKREILFNLIETYQSLLHSLELLIENDLVHFDLKSENILYNKQSQLPIIIDFGLSFNTKYLKSKDKIKKIFYIYEPKYYIWPIEVHLINYILYKANGALNEENIETVVSGYMRTDGIFDIVSSNFKEDYKNAAIKYFKQYIGMPNNTIIDLLSEYHNTWDNYALNILYLKLFGLVFPSGINKNKLLVSFSQLLLINVSFDPSKRLKPEETKNKFKNLFFYEDDSTDLISLIKQFEYNKKTITKSMKADTIYIN